MWYWYSMLTILYSFNYATYCRTHEWMGCDKKPTWSVPPEAETSFPQGSWERSPQRGHLPVGAAWGTFDQESQKCFWGEAVSFSALKSHVYYWELVLRWFHLFHCYFLQLRKCLSMGRMGFNRQIVWDRLMLDPHPGLRQCSGSIASIIVVPCKSLQQMQHLV